MLFVRVLDSSICSVYIECSLTSFVPLVILASFFSWTQAGLNFEFEQKSVLLLCACTRSLFFWLGGHALRLVMNLD